MFSKFIFIHIFVKLPKPCLYIALWPQHGLSFKARRLKLCMQALHMNWLKFAIFFKIFAIFTKFRQFFFKYSRFFQNFRDFFFYFFFQKIFHPKSIMKCLNCLSVFCGFYQYWFLQITIFETISTWLWIGVILKRLQV